MSTGGAAEWSFNANCSRIAPTPVNGAGRPDPAWLQVWSARQRVPRAVAAEYSPTIPLSHVNLSKLRTAKMIAHLTRASCTALLISTPQPFAL